MDLAKLNQCLSYMDILTKVDLDYQNTTAKIVFNCFSGGQYEDVELVLKLDVPYYFHLPFALSGEFQIIECTPAELEQLVGSEYYEGYYSAIRLIVDNKMTNFYCCCYDVEWSLSGAQTLSEHELAPEL